MHAFGDRSPGFTLIELLVVIAIIGLLAAVIVASLSGARNKGSNAAIEAELYSARSQAEIFASNNNGHYMGVCGAPENATTNGMGGQSGPGMLLNAANYTGASVDTTNTDPGKVGQVTCHDNNTGWVIQAPLSSGGFWCVDSIGSATTTTSALAGSQYTCPTS